MNRAELRAAFSLSGVYSLRMLGLFMILPVFSLYAGDLEEVTPALAGLAIGVYGITQALLQIPAGLLSDRIGRKPVIIGGLLVFALGSVVAAQADTIGMVIAGRALQGAGAIAAAIMALLADLTREEHRIKAMALIGMSIGVSFAAAMVLGPVINQWVGVPGIFWITAIMATGGILVVQFMVPQPQVLKVHREAEPVPAQFGRVLRDPQLLRLDFGILLLHTLLTATFVVMPLVLRDVVGLDAAMHWKVYLPVLLCSVIAMVPFIFLAERKGRVKGVFTMAVVVIGLAQLALFVLPLTLLSVVVCLFLFFAAFNLLEAMLPSLISRAAPVECRGTAMGFYSSAQFFGAFLGGVLGGVIHGLFGLQAVFLGLALLTVVWLLLVIGMVPPRQLGSYVYRVDVIDTGAAAELTRQLVEVEGVVEAVVVPEDGVAYLRIDRQRFNADKLP